MIVPTVRVKGGSKGSRIINESDFDPKVHQLADPPARHPLDHDGDGFKGGSLPEVDPVEAPSSPPVEKPAPKPRPRRRKKAK